MSADGSRSTFGRHSIGVMKRRPTAERLEHETRNLGVNMAEEIDRSALPIRRQRWVVFDIDPHLTEADRQATHEHEQHAALAHGIGA